MSVACIIPARFDSSRFLGKLLEKVLGETVLQRTLKNAKACQAFDALYVATDDARIAEHVQHVGEEFLFTSSLPRDGTERAIEAMGRYPVLQQFDSIMVLQGDHPCTPPQTMESIVQALHSDPVAVLSTAVAPIQNEEDFLSPHVVKCVFDQSQNALYFSRSPIPYCGEKGAFEAFAHIGIYCYRRPFLEQIAQLKPTSLQVSEDLEQLKILQLGYRIKVALANEKTPSVDIPSDLSKVEEYLSRQSCKQSIP